MLSFTRLTNTNENQRTKWHPPNCEGQSNFDWLKFRIVE